MNTTVFSARSAQDFLALLQDHGSCAAFLCDQPSLAYCHRNRLAQKYPALPQTILLPFRGSLTLEEADRCTLKAQAASIHFVLAAGSREVCNLGRIVAEWLDLPLFLMPSEPYDPQTPSAPVYDEYGAFSETYEFEDTPVAVMTDFFPYETFCRAAGGCC